MNHQRFLYFPAINSMDVSHMIEMSHMHEKDIRLSCSDKITGASDNRFIDEESGQFLIDMHMFS